ncbi:MAG: excinuclease ABC subunit UvrA [Candidatus Eisenbacteria bacterium]|nr:excinuclease ABC subunit UvrA [Candidatus Eisenbacteria bacterium]
MRGAREHNLKNIDVDIPRNSLIVVTGVSGSGKSSLAFDTIYAEGQRRYVESLSAYARQFLGQMEKPDVDSIEGLSPAISIEQRTAGANPRSTVATVTELYDYLRLIFSRLGVQHCHKCGALIGAQTPSQIVDSLIEVANGKTVQVMAPIVRGRKGEYKKELDAARRQGFLRARIDGELVELEKVEALKKTKKHTIDILVDRLTADAKNQSRLVDSVETALKAAGGVVSVLVGGGGGAGGVGGSGKEGSGATAGRGGPAKELLFSEKRACVRCGIGFDDLKPRNFSFNNPYGACSTCDGLGTRLEIDPSLVVPNPTLSISKGAVAAWGASSSVWFNSQMRALAKHYDFDLDMPFQELPERVKEIILFGAGHDEVEFTYKSKNFTMKGKRKFPGIVHDLARRYRATTSGAVRDWLDGFMARGQCPVCEGKRLKPESLAVTLKGRNIAEYASLSVKEAKALFEKMEFRGSEIPIAEPILKEIVQRLKFLCDVGLDYLTLDRNAATLAGGEAQRLRLATQIGSRLSGVLYVLDEPSIGLHHRDQRRLLGTLCELRDMGNTVLVVEHDRDTILSADHVVDLGPGAGERGGWLVATGKPAEIAQNSASLTGLYLSGKKDVEVPRTRRRPQGACLTVKGAAANNLKSIDVSFPLGLFVCVTGVSGSGKSTLINDILYRALARHFYSSPESPGKHRAIEGLQHIDKVVDIDQSPIGRTPRSNAATYVGAFGFMRSLFAQLPEAKVRGYLPGRFSFNVHGGRCEACQGDGVVKIEMHFLPDVYVTCDTCRGKRYNRDTLEVLYKGKSIADVLDMTVDAAHQFFLQIPPVRRKLEALNNVGLGYLRLGQPATRLSGGEAQRVKLATELSKVATGKTLYILDEPTTGLHFDDVRLLLHVLTRLVAAGNTVIVIEHNLDVVKAADHIIDLGPEGGDDGGRVVALGTPEELASCAASHTGKALRDVVGVGGK